MPASPILSGEGLRPILRLAPVTRRGCAAAKGAGRAMNNRNPGSAKELGMKKWSRKVGLAVWLVAVGTVGCSAGNGDGGVGHGGAASMGGRSAGGAGGFGDGGRGGSGGRAAGGGNSGSPGGGPGDPSATGGSSGGSAGAGGSSIPAAIAAASRKRLSAGDAFTCAIRPDRSVACWGLNTYGQLGDGTNADRTGPVTVMGLTDVIAIAGGGAHACALVSNGSVVCWGNNEVGQLGDGTMTDRSVPVAVPGVGGVVSLSAGYTHTCVVKSDGSVLCWGSNVNGEVGSAASPAHLLVPTPLTAVSGAAAVSCGAYYTCTAQADGTALCWGLNDNGQIGDGTLPNTTTTANYIKRPTPVLGVSDVLVVSTASQHACALTTHGAIACWGNNSSGQVGDIIEKGAIPVPSTIASVTALAMAAGSDSTCWINVGGTVTCRGAASNGGPEKAPDNSTTGATPGVADATSITSGKAHSCVSRSDGTVVCWGGWDFGLGNAMHDVNNPSLFIVPDVVVTP